MATTHGIRTVIVKGRFLAGSLDGPDIDIEPDAEPLEGLRIVLSPKPTLLELQLDDPPSTMLLEPFTLVTNDQGTLQNPDTGAVVIRIPADYPHAGGGLQRIIWTSDVQTPAGRSIVSKQWATPEGATEVDLTTVTPIPGTTVINLTEWEALAANIRASKDLAYLSAQTANQAKLDTQALVDQASAITGLTGEDAAVALLVNTETSQTRLALDGANGANGAALPVGKYLDIWEPLDVPNTGTPGAASAYIALADAALGGHAAKETLGKSGDGAHDIYSYTVGNGPYRAMMVGVHGREGIAQTLRWVESFAKHPEMAALRDAFTICYIPLLNPYGYETGGSQFPNGGDGNRSWAFFWDRYTDQVGGTRPKGPAVMNAAETQLLKSKVDAFKPRLLVDTHGQYNSGWAGWYLRWVLGHRDASSLLVEANSSLGGGSHASPARISFRTYSTFVTNFFTEWLLNGTAEKADTLTWIARKTTGSDTVPVADGGRMVTRAEAPVQFNTITPGGTAGNSVNVVMPFKGMLVVGYSAWFVSKGSARPSIPDWGRMWVSLNGSAYSDTAATYFEVSATTGQRTSVYGEAVFDFTGQAPDASTVFTVALNTRLEHVGGTEVGHTIRTPTLKITAIPTEDEDQVPFV